MENQVSDKLRKNIFIVIICVLILASIVVVIRNKAYKKASSLESVMNGEIAIRLEESNKELILFRQAEAINDIDGIKQHLTKAIEFAKAAEAIKPDSPETIEYLGKIYIEASAASSEALDLAGYYYEKLKNIKPDYATVYNNLGYILYMKAENSKDVAQKEEYYNESLQYYSTALEKDSSVTTSQYGKAIALDKLGRTDEAVLAMEIAFEKDANNQNTAFELGRMYYNLAINQIDPKEDEIIDQDNQYVARARELFEGVIAKVTDHANARFSLATLYLKIGEIDKAREQIFVLREIVKENDKLELINEQFGEL